MAWRPDPQLAGFEALELAAPDDYDGRVVATLGDCPEIGGILVLTQAPAAIAAALPEEPAVAVRPSGDGIARSIAAVAGGPDAPWPVRRGGWILRLYEHSLGLAFVALFLLSWAGHALGGFAEYAADQAAHQQAAPALSDYLASARFWFESFQNWQSEFLAIAAMVWLAVYLRQRWSPESKPVHAPHAETGR